MARWFWVGWLVGCFGLSVFQSISGLLPQRGRKRRERIDESKNVQTTPNRWGWSGGAMVLGKLPVPGRPAIWITVGQGPTALTGWGLFGHFYSHLSFFLRPRHWKFTQHHRTTRPPLGWCWENFQCRGVLQFGLQ